MSTFIISRRKEGEYLFSFKDKYGETILTSEIYPSTICCKNAVQSAKNSSLDENKFEVKSNSSDQFHFYLKSNCGEIIGKSPYFKTKQSLQSGIEYMKRIAGDSSVEQENY
ncbi:YegP family protein [Chryseobacterium sp.]|uniref:YegP family protein n=1 Tax=Chryseobacterium sp. TaxID=1871047 RepID=UPI00388D6470